MLCTWKRQALLGSILNGGGRRGRAQSPSTASGRGEQSGSGAEGLTNTSRAFHPSPTVGLTDASSRQTGVNLPEEDPTRPTLTPCTENVPASGSEASRQPGCHHVREAPDASAMEMPRTYGQAVALTNGISPRRGRRCSHVALAPSAQAWVTEAPAGGDRLPGCQRPHGPPAPASARRQTARRHTGPLSACCLLFLTQSTSGRPHRSDGASPNYLFPALDPLALVISYLGLQSNLK